MNSLFPDLLFLGPFFAPLLLRVGVAVYFLLSAHRNWLLGAKKNKFLAAKEAALALFLLAGFLTQLVALLSMLVVLFRGMWLKAEVKKENWATKAAVIAILLALVITGAGAFAIDRPY